MSDLPEKYRKLSKHLSYLLRHHPEEAKLEIDRMGFTDLGKLLRSLKDTKYSWANKDDFEFLIDNSDKNRFEIRSGKIRALYGHSIDVEIKDPTQPPNVLYHGTSPRSLESILEEGLKPMNRQYVHLSKSIKEAYQVGKRHHEEPVILKIDAKIAWDNGIKFYERPDVFLTKKIPPIYVSIYEN